MINRLLAILALVLAACSDLPPDELEPDAGLDANGPALCPSSSWVTETCVRTCRGGFAGEGAHENECLGDCARHRYGVNYAPPCPPTGLCDVGALECDLLCTTDDPALTQRCGSDVPECVRACLALELGGAWSPSGVCR